MAQPNGPKRRESDREDNGTRVSFEEKDGYTPTSVYLPWESDTVEAIAANRDFDSVSAYCRFLIRQDVQLQIEDKNVALLLQDK